MNIQLIQHNLKLINENVQNGRSTEAGKLTLLMAKMMLEKPDCKQTDTAMKRNLYGAYGGAAVALKECYDMLLQDYSPSKEIEQLNIKIVNINDQIAECAQSTEEVEKNNNELFAAEEKLKKKQKQLQEKKDKLQELIELKENGLSKLECEIKEMDEKLKALDETCKKALEEKEKWAQVFTTDQQLIAELPESIADKTIDALIGQAKDYIAHVQQTGNEGEEWLRTIIEAIEGIRERINNSAQE